MAIVTDLPSGPCALSCAVRLRFGATATVVFQAVGGAGFRRGCLDEVAVLDGDQAVALAGDVAVAVARLHDDLYELALGVVAEEDRATVQEHDRLQLLVVVLEAETL